MLPIKSLQYFILQRIFSLPPLVIFSSKTASHPSANKFFDRFWRDWSQWSTNSTRLSATKDTKIYRRRACGFDSLTASKPTHKKGKSALQLICPDGRRYKRYSLAFPRGVPRYPSVMQSTCFYTLIIHDSP